MMLMKQINKQNRKSRKKVVVQKNEITCVAVRHLIVDDVKCGYVFKSNKFLEMNIIP